MKQHTHSCGPKHTLPRVAYRYLSGRPLDGVPHTNGGWWRRGQPGSASWWACLPGWKRQIPRLGIPAVVLPWWAAYLADPGATVADTAIIGLVAALYAARAARGWFRTRRFRAVYTSPTLAALKGTLGGETPVHLHVDPKLGNLIPRLVRAKSPAEETARRWYGEHVEPVVRWAPDRGMRALWGAQKTARPLTGRWRRAREAFRVPREDPGPRIEVRVGVPHLTAERRGYVSAVITAKIPAGDLIETWDQVGKQVTATWIPRRRPPSAVGYADLDARFTGLEEWEFFVGLGPAGKKVVVSLKADSPHIACSAASGAGKSVLAQLIGVQVLARGGQVVILDLKGSHRWARDLPGVTYCLTAGQMHEALLDLEQLADRRNQGAYRHEDENWDPGPRHLVIAEELNATMSMLRSYWAGSREKGDPKASPAVEAFRKLLFMGRSAKVNVFAVAQMLTANTTGGPESRENFGIRCLARYTKNNWQMLVPEAGMPRTSRTLGRWQIVVGGTATECQVCFLDKSDARLFIAKHAGVPVSYDSASGDRRAADQEMSYDSGSGGASCDMPPDPLSAALTLRDALDQGLVPWPVAAARKRIERSRNKGKDYAPVPVRRDGKSDVYRVGDLIEWVEGEKGLRKPRRPAE